MPTAPDPIPADPAAQAISQLLPEMRAAQRSGWAMAIGGFLVLGALALFLVTREEDWVTFGIFCAILAVMLPFWVATDVRRKHERQILPVIARTFGLTHRKDPGEFFSSLPPVFIPRGGRRSADDQMSGRVADRWFRFTEVKTETGGKHSRTLFQGVVVEVENRHSLPPFVIASTRETKGFLFLRGNVHVEGMDYHEGVTGPDGTYYGLWSPPDTGLDQLQGVTAFLQRMVNIGPEVLGTSKLYSVACTGNEVLVALAHSRDLFRIGGMFTDEQKVMADIRSAAAEFSHPVQLVAEVIRAAEGLTAAPAA
jgi:hypothetical protein